MKAEDVIAKIEECKRILEDYEIEDASLIEALEICKEAFEEKVRRSCTTT